MAWYPAWESANKVTAASFPWSELTQIDNFALVTSSDLPVLEYELQRDHASQSQTFVSQVHAHGEQALFSIGGSNDQNWPTACLPANQSTFAGAIANYIQTYGYDGVDLDNESSLVTSSNLGSCFQTI